MNEPWTLTGYNDTDETLMPDGDWPVPPGGLVSRLYCDTEEEARSWLEVWLVPETGPRRRVVLAHNGETVEEHVVRSSRCPRDE